MEILIHPPYCLKEASSNYRSFRHLEKLPKIQYDMKNYEATMKKSIKTAYRRLLTSGKKISTAKAI